jgi:hypothetical protein
MFDFGHDTRQIEAAVENEYVERLYFYLFFISCSDEPVITETVIVAVFLRVTIPVVVARL